VERSGPDLLYRFIASINLKGLKNYRSPDYVGVCFGDRFRASAY